MTKRAFYDLKYHLVWISNYRRKYIGDQTHEDSSLQLRMFENLSDAPQLAGG